MFYDDDDPAYRIDGRPLNNPVITELGADFKFAVSADRLHA